MIRNILQYQLRQQISSLTGNDFQEFVVELMFHRYGSDGFIALRRVKDGGADGIIPSKSAVIACWGPDSQAPSKVKKAFEKKAQADYESYKENWQTTHPTWIVAINREPAPQEIQFVQRLQAGSQIIGIDAILHIINNEITCASRRKVLETLKISTDLLSADVVSGLLEDILKNADGTGTVEYTAPLYISDKILINFAPHEADTVEQEYSDLQEEYFSAIADAFVAFDDEEKKRIKRRIVSDYVIANGDSTSAKMTALTLQYLAKYSSFEDVEYREMIRALLFWVFEQCLIGIKTNSEQSGSRGAEIFL